jgi:hypothetical protein
VIDEEGAYFIDRDGQFFAPVLTWLRTSALSIPSTMTKEDVLREAKFYALEPLVEELCAMSQVEDLVVPLQCPTEIVKYVAEYFSRHETTIITFLRKLNKEVSKLLLSSC